MGAPEERRAGRGVRGARGPRRRAPGSLRGAPRGGRVGGNAAGAHGAWRCCGRGSGARARAGLQGALALTCSGRVGAARLPSCRSCRSPAPDHVPGPSPSPAFPHPLVRPPPAPPGSRALPPFPLPPDVRPPREQEPKREGSEDSSQGRGLRGAPDAWGPGPRSPGLQPDCARGSWSPRCPALSGDRDSRFQPPGKGESRI